MLKPYKFLVTAVVQEVDDNGNVIGERSVGAEGGPAVVFGCDGLAQFATDFQSRLDSLAPTDT